MFLLTFEFVFNEIMLFEWEPSWCHEEKFPVGMVGLMFQSSLFGMLILKDLSDLEAGEIKPYLT